MLIKSFDKGDMLLCVDDNPTHYLEVDADVTLGKVYECNYTFTTNEGFFIRFDDDKKNNRCMLSTKFINCDDPKNKAHIKSIRLGLLQNKLKRLLR